MTPAQLTDCDLGQIHQLTARDDEESVTMTPRRAGCHLHQCACKGKTVEITGLNEASAERHERLTGEFTSRQTHPGG